MNCGCCKIEFDSQPHELLETIICNDCFNTYEDKRRTLLRLYEKQLIEWLKEFLFETPSLPTTVDSNHLPEDIFG